LVAPVDDLRQRRGYPAGLRYYLFRSLAGLATIPNMKKLSSTRISLIVSMVLFLVSVSYSGEAETVRGTVAHVRDGDTLVLRTGTGTNLEIRLANIDSPETRKVIGKKPDRTVIGGQPFADSARKALESKVLFRRVRVEVDDMDRYGRSVGVVFCEGRNVNMEMVKDGWAWAYVNRFARPQIEDYVDAERQARSTRTGLWRQPNPQPPWEFRRDAKQADEWYRH
jgi:micrococcal nuclease